MKKRAAKHLHFRKPGDPMFDNNRVDTSQVEYRGSSQAGRSLSKPNMFPAPGSGEASGTIMGWPQPPKGNAKFKKRKGK